jgi:serine/threonine protein kinase
MKKLSLEILKFFLSEILIALDFLHSKNTYYRDLKPENILVTLDGHIKLIDFGLSKINQDERLRTHTICGTPQYMPPEMFSGKGCYLSSDWWSFVRNHYI